MQNKPEKNYLEWFKKAQEDELSTKIIITEGGAPTTACFLSQQIAEKYLKGLLVFYKKNFPKIHDLLELETLLLKIVPEIKEIHPDLEFLNRYYIETRYPGEYPQFTFKEAREAYEKALKIKKFVTEKII